MIPRALLAIDPGPLPRQLKRRLVEREVEVEIVRGKTRLWERLGRELCDLIVVSLDRIPEPAAETIATVNEVPDAPAVVVLAELDADTLAHLQAAGCAAVLDPEVSLPALLDVLDTVLEERREAIARRLDARRLYAHPRLADFVSHSPTMGNFVSVVRRVVPSDISLLILGETGVGKERLAQAIHYEGPRAQGPFIAINCGALPETLLESELFGHEEGAFTGAMRSRRGCFELAHAGTVFLDEIGELPLPMQVRLLRVLQEREVRRLGSERSTAVDVRVMAATNRDLEQEVEDGQFRQDLYYRLGVMTLKIPPLRERREDIPDLVENFIAYLRPRVRGQARGITEQALAALCDYRWPGNVRELMNVIERALLLCPNDAIDLGELPVAISDVEPAAVALVSTANALEEATTMPEGWLERPWREVRAKAVAHLERAYLAGLLEVTGGRIGETAARAGMEPRSLYAKMRKHRLQKEDFKHETDRS